MGIILQFFTSIVYAKFSTNSQPISYEKGTNERSQRWINKNVLIAP